MRAFIFDIDGVIHVNGTVVPGAIESLGLLREAGKTVMFLTNNSTASPQDVSDLFERMGGFARPEEVVTSALVAAEFFESRNLRGRKVYVVGSDTLAQLVQKLAGVKTFGVLEDVVKTREDAVREFVPSLSPPPSEVAAVLVGNDYNINWYKLTRAANYLWRNPSCLFVATNP